MRVISAAPDADALRSSALASILPAAALGMLAAAALAEVAGLSTAYPWRAAVLLAAGAALLLLRVAGHHPHRTYGIANQLTLTRAVGVALLIAMLAEPRLPQWTAFGIGVAAASLDAIDGRLARSRGLSSPYGARFDMETDALLILALSVLLWREDKTGAWVLLSGAMRYAFVLARLALPRLDAPLAPSRRRQTIAVVQVVALLIAAAPFVPASIAQAVAAAGLASLLASFGIDFRASWRGGRAAS